MTLRGGPFQPRDNHAGQRSTAHTKARRRRGKRSVAKSARAHPVSCVDCHDPKMMSLRVTRPGFMVGIQALRRTATSPHRICPASNRGAKARAANPTIPTPTPRDRKCASFVCGQCHVEYYCGPKETLFFPWGKGLKVEQIESYYDEHKFPNGEPFYDSPMPKPGACLQGAASGI